MLVQNYDWFDCLKPKPNLATALHIIGEAKSLGKGELIKPKDLTKLKAIASRLSDAVVVISVLRDHFTAVEGRRRISLPLFPSNMGS